MTATDDQANQAATVTPENRPQTPAESAFAAPRTDTPANAPAPEAPPKPKYEITPENMSDELFLAVRRGEVEKVRALLNQGADVNTPESNGTTVLMTTVIENQKEIAQEILIRNDVNLNAQDDRGMTALMLAAAHNNIELAKILLNSMSSTSLENLEGDTADDIARARGNYALAELIVQRQRQRQANEEFAKEEAALHKDREAEDADKTAKAIFGDGTETPKIEIAPEPVPAGFMHRMSKFFGLSKFFGPNAAAPELAPGPAPIPVRGGLVMNFLKHFRPGA